jgi:hypothetical protein
MGMGDKERAMENIAHCFINFGLFRGDIKILIAEGVIKHEAFDRYEWTKSKTSLAEYFKWIGGDAPYVPGGFWAPVEKTFSIKRGTLRKLAGNNANPLKPPESKDFIKIKEMVLRYRAEIAREQKEKAIFVAIKRLMDETQDSDPETIRKNLKRIKEFFD